MGQGPDRLDFIHAVCQQIPDPKWHPVRTFGACSCKKRKVLREARAGERPTQGEDEVPAEALLVPSTDAPPSATPGSAEARRRSSWARMLRMVFEVDPLVCLSRGERDSPLAETAAALRHVETGHACGKVIVST